MNNPPQNDELVHIPAGPRHFHLALKRERERFKFTRAELGARVGASPAKIANWEDDVRVPTKVEFKRLVGTLRVLRYYPPVYDDGEDGGREPEPLVVTPLPLPVSAVPTSTLTFGDALKRERELEGVTQTEVGQLLDVEQGSVSRWERGGPIQEQYYAKLCIVFPRLGEAAKPTLSVKYGRLNGPSVPEAPPAPAKPVVSPPVALAPPPPAPDLGAKVTAALAQREAEERAQLQRERDEAQERREMLEIREREEAERAAKAAAPQEKRHYTPRKSKRSPIEQAIAMLTAVHGPAWWLTFSSTADEAMAERVAGPWRVRAHGNDVGLECEHETIEAYGEDPDSACIALIADITKKLDAEAEKLRAQAARLERMKRGEL